MTGGVTTLVHNRVELALHHLRDADGRPLLLLHGLGDRSPGLVPGWAESWTGPIVALDFTGHGASTVPRGGGYTAEVLLADADAALAHVGPLTVAGTGIGAYVALMLAGARAAEVHGAVLLDGPGLAGGASHPAGTTIFRRTERDQTGAPDPYAISELGRDLRPGDYAATFVRLAMQGSSLDEPISVAARFRPPWLADVVREHGVVEEPATAALARFAAAG